MVASFHLYFGAAVGTDIREWASRYGWALAWVNFPPCQDPRRLMDAMVLNATTANATVAPSYASSFATAWAQVVHARANASAFRKTGTAFMNGWWHNLTNATITQGSVTLFNIGALDCSDGDNCIGMTRSGVCVCYQP